MLLIPKVCKLCIVFVPLCNILIALLALKGSIIIMNALVGRRKTYEFFNQDCLVLAKALLGM